MEIANIGPWLAGWMVTALVGGLGAYLGAYFSKKGKNLATKEDTGEITRIQEKIRNEFVVGIESLKSKENMRLAVVERRFHAHQEAYSLWLELFQGMHQEDNFDRVLKCQSWWNSNGLYLDEAPRKSFRDAYIAASMHRDILNVPAEMRDEESTQSIKENWDRIKSAGPAIESAVSLPSLGDLAVEGPVAGE